MTPYEMASTRQEKVKQEKIGVVVKLRDEQHLTFKQIATQVNKSESWCSRVYRDRGNLDD